MSCEEEFVPTRNAEAGIAAASMPVTVNAPAFDIDTSCDGVTAAGRFDPLPTHNLPEVSASATSCALLLVPRTVADTGIVPPSIWATVVVQEPGVFVTSPVSAMKPSQPSRPFASEGMEVSAIQFVLFVYQYAPWGLWPDTVPTSFKVVLAFTVELVGVAVSTTLPPLV